MLSQIGVRLFAVTVKACLAVSLMSSDLTIMIYLSPTTPTYVITYDHWHSWDTTRYIMSP